MLAQQNDLHGSAPDNTSVALLLIDVINDLEFDGGEALLAHALPMAMHIAALKRRAAQVGIPAIYVNDNFGRWQSDFAKLLAHCLHDGVRGQPLSRAVAARIGGLLRAKAEALRFLCHHAGPPPAASTRDHRHAHRADRGHLCAVHRQ